MKRYVKYLLQEGGVVIVEVEEPTSGLVPAARSGELIVESKQRFDDALEALKPVAGKIIGKISDLSEIPEEVGVEFGLNMGFEAGVVIASGSTNANFKVMLKWKPERKKVKPADI